MSGPLAIDDLTLDRGGRRVLDRVSFDLRPGEIIAVIGPNGAGKTSLLEAILGFLPLASGRVTHAGRTLGGLHDRARVFSYMPDAAEPPAEVRVRTLVDHARRYGRAPASLGDELVQTLGLARLLPARAGELSRGEKRRLGLHAALATSRPVVVLDEPLGAFDPLQLLDVLAVLKRRAAAGTSLLLSVHQMADAEKIASRVLFIAAGRVAAFGTIDELRARSGGSGSLEEVFLAILRREGREASDARA